MQFFFSPSKKVNKNEEFTFSYHWKLVRFHLISSRIYGVIRNTEYLIFVNFNENFSRDRTQPNKWSPTYKLSMWSDVDFSATLTVNIDSITRILEVTTLFVCCFCCFMCVCFLLISRYHSVFLIRRVSEIWDSDKNYQIKALNWNDDDGDVDDDEDDNDNTSDI